jgi:hypothetical protein
MGSEKCMKTLRDRGIKEYYFEKIITDPQDKNE